MLCIYFLSLLLVTTTFAQGDDEVQPGLSSAEILASDWQTDEDEDDDRTMDEIIVAAGTEAGIEEAGRNRLINIQEDMLLDPLQYELYYGNRNGFSGAGVTDPAYRWPEAIIPYTVDEALEGTPTKTVFGAMKEWMERTCIRFEPAGSDAAEKTGHNNAIKIIDGAGCRAGIGYWGKSYSVSLSRKGCTRHKSHLHELGHAIGLHHEQCRTDRDDAIKVIWDNISLMGQLQYTAESAASAFGIPYDFCSIMHYGPKYFSLRKKFSMLARDQDYQWTMGSAQNLSFGDAKIVNLMYNCNKGCSKTIDCKDPCYINHKCQCECEKTPCKKIPCEQKSSKRDCDWAKRNLSRG